MSHTAQPREMLPSQEQHKQTGLVKTPMYCHSCGITFVAVIDFDLNGNHVVECPSCGHSHYRLIRSGFVTSERYNSDYNTIKVTNRTLWKSNTVPIQTSTSSQFLRDMWLNRE